MAYYVGEETRVTPDGKQEKVFVFSCVPKEIRERYEQYKKQAAQRKLELTKIADEAIKTNQTLTTESHQLLLNLYNEIANEKIERPDISDGKNYSVRPFTDVAEKVGDHIRILALDTALQQLKQAGYQFFPDDLNFLKYLVGDRRSGFWVSDNNSQFNIRMDMNNIYVTPFGETKQHGEKKYPYSQILSLPQILSSFD
jgi:hypothetical protein